MDDPAIWQRIAITVLTLLAFLMAAGGLFHAFLTGRRVARRVSELPGIRRAIDDEHQRRRRAIELQPELARVERERLLSAESDRWIAGYEAAGLEAPTIANLGSGLEPIAEDLVRELSKGSQADLWVAGAGLALGLIASVWGTWLT